MTFESCLAVVRTDSEATAFSLFLAWLVRLEENAKESIGANGNDDQATGHADGEHPAQTVYKNLDEEICHTHAPKLVTLCHGTAAGA